MIFAIATDDLGLMVFATPPDAVAYCEGIDVQQGGWEFYGEDGRPWEAKFTRAATAGRFVVDSGEYTLMPSSQTGLPSLRERLDLVRYVEGVPGLSSIADIRRLLG
jgi:hypothetical protein